MRTVLLHNSRNLARKGDVLKNSFDGPLIIDKITKRNTVYLKTQDGKNMRGKTGISISRIRKFLEHPLELGKIFL